VNKLIEQLMDQANGHIGERVLRDDEIVKFAMLLIRECGNIADDSVEIGFPSNDIERHFGIEWDDPLWST